MRFHATIMPFFGLLAAGIAAWPGAVPAQSSTVTDKNVEAIALQWFERMRTGHIDRTQLAPEYSAQLTDDVVQEMSKYLSAYKYGTSPTGALVLNTRSTGDQTFYEVKITFPRGDAASLLFGFNAQGKITGIVILGMAGD